MFFRAIYSSLSSKDVKRFNLDYLTLYRLILILKLVVVLILDHIFWLRFKEGYLYLVPCSLETDNIF